MMELRGCKTNPHRTLQRDMLGIHQPEIHLDILSCRTEEMEFDRVILKIQFSSEEQST